MPIDLSTVQAGGTVRELALRYIAELPAGQALTAAEIAERAQVNPRSVLGSMKNYPWKLLVRVDGVRSTTVYMSKGTYEAHQERSGTGTSVKTPSPRRRR